MSEGSKRTLAWREKKREEGYQPVTVWVPAQVKHQMVNDAFQRHQDLGELLVEVYLAHPPTKSGRGAALLDRRQIEALVQDQIVQALARQPLVPAPPAAPAAPPPRAAAPAGMKVCPKAHAYPASRKECPECATLRKRAMRQRQAEARKGELPP